MKHRMSFKPASEEVHQTWVSQPSWLYGLLVGAATIVVLFLIVSAVLFWTMPVRPSPEPEYEATIHFDGYQGGRFSGKGAGRSFPDCTQDPIPEECHETNIVIR